MTNPEYQKYDFDAAARVGQPVRAGLNSWTRKAAELFVEQWQEFSQTSMVAVPCNVDGRPFESMQQTWPKQATGVSVSFGNEKITGIILASNNELLILLLDVLGGSLDETTERALTSIERDLATLIFETLASSYGDAWSGQEALSFEVAELEDEPGRSRMFGPSDDVFSTGLRIQIGDSTGVLQLVVDALACRSMLGVADAGPAKANNRPISQEKVSRLNVSISAELGRAQIDMQELVQIEPGDILILDQTVQSPITVTANGDSLFHAWPGKRSNMQSVQIANVIGEAS